MRLTEQSTHTPENVVGSSAKVKFELRDGKPRSCVCRKSTSSTTDPGNLSHQRTHRTPSDRRRSELDGDLQMLQWTMGGDGLRFALIVHHTTPSVMGLRPRLQYGRLTSARPSPGERLDRCRHEKRLEDHFSIRSKSEGREAR